MSRSKRHRSFSVAFVVSASALAWACGDAPAVEAGAPLVIASVPADGDVGVDASLGEIRAIFSEAMRTEGWSWVTEAGRSAPVVTGIPHYVDEVTAVLPVQLAPHTTYVLWVNSPHDEQLRKFESQGGVKAPAHRIRFTTGE